MTTLSYIGVFLGIIALCESIGPGAYLQLDSCALKNAVTDILTDENTLKKMVESPETKKALGKKNKSPIKGITNVKVDKIAFSKISITILPDTGIEIFVTNKIEISGKSFLGGRTDMKIEVDIITNTSLKKENVDCPIFVKVECKTHIINYDANLPRGILPNVVTNFFDKTLKTLLPTTVCPAVEFVISEMNEKLCMKNTSMPFGQSGSLHYMTSPIPTVSEEHIDIELNVEVFKGENLINPPDDIDTSSLVLPYISETTFLLTADFLGQVFTVFQEEGAFNFMAIEDDLVNGGAMSTSILSEIIPELSSGLQDYKINIFVNKSALVTATSKKAILHLYSTMEVSASSPDSESQTLFEVNLHMNFNLQITADKKSLTFQISLDKTFLALESSTVGEFEVQDLNEFINSMINTLYTPTINGIIQPIPIPNVLQKLDINLANGQIEIYKDLILISVNVCKA
ncbi:BPI fold-containing family B member 6-like [Anomaloglossus baeobatrachus]|uniref:BPI fold-containing family B member 6-like n=1 Tax=Anomaloglossus baeobatrachus TaxID=238106 RepID=UPI003F4FB620